MKSKLARNLIVLGFVSWSVCSIARASAENELPLLRGVSVFKSVQLDPTKAEIVASGEVGVTCDVYPSLYSTNIGEGNRLYLQSVADSDVSGVDSTTLPKSIRVIVVSSHDPNSRLPGSGEARLQSLNSAKGEGTYWGTPGLLGDNYEVLKLQCKTNK